MIRPRDDLALAPGYHSPQVDVAVRLNTNESPEPPPSAWVDEIRDAAGRIDWHRYPDRRARALRDAVGGLHGVGPEQVFVANGSNEVLQTVLLTYGGAGRSAAVFEPTYALHAHIARLTGTAVVVGTRGPDFLTDLAEVQRVIRDATPSIVFLCSPNNPTGTLDDESTVRAVLDAVAEHDGLLVVDEAYGQFAPWSAVDLVADEVPLVVTRTFSKTWSMAAARVGYCVAPAAIVRELDEVVLPYHLDAFKQEAARLAVAYTAEMDARVARVVEERGRLLAALAGLPVDVWPSDANFILFRPRAVDGRAVWQALVDRGVLVRDCSSWPRLEGCLRVTVGTEAEGDAFLAALGGILDAGPPVGD